jgi:hypothetical protein
MVFHGNLDEWRKRLLHSAMVHHTLLGDFQHGKFLLSDGRRFDFSAIVVDRVKNRTYPKDW